MEEKKKLKWYRLKEVQGLGLMVAGMAMFFNPVLALSAPYFLSVGVGWAGAGLTHRVNGKPQNGKKKEEEK